MEFGLYQSIHTSLSVFGVGINIFLLYLALTKSPKIMRPCSALITNKSLTDIMSSLANLFNHHRRLLCHDHPTGPCTSIGPTACYAGHMFMGSFLEHNLIWLIACYLFRYYILYVRDPSIKSIIFAALVVYTPSFIHMAVWIKLFDSGPKDTMMNSTGSDNSSLSKSSEMILTGSAVYWSSLVVFAQLVITAILVVIAYTWIRNVLINFILSMGATLSKDVKIINKQLVKILTFQVCIPIWIFLGVFFFLAMYTQNAQPDILQYSITISFMLAPVISPFAYIFFVPHYWNFCIGKKYVTPSTTSICGSSSNCGSVEKKSMT
ncbi:hypothetical protein GCK72_012708 [Caenorhabditis remanei]|uniref:Uncharacterized protein n=1 Tax=Caenorhabditis remanei TaxID=31234 RepID=A0A6A5GNZ2_CAERE|nr:hypothetical protein GCK72_012708 [Caenorhabditis remanei]KAF1756255.1 hypothetical protein GCK72_012708 [Caenorhabditis remanei]